MKTLEPKVGQISGTSCLIKKASVNKNLKLRQTQNFGPIKNRDLIKVHKTQMVRGRTIYKSKKVLYLNRLYKYDIKLMHLL